MNVKDEVEAAHGVAIAQTALLSALIGVLKARGVITDAHLDVIFDSAITQVETAPSIDPELGMRARRVLEVIATEMAGPPKARD